MESMGGREGGCKTNVVAFEKKEEERRRRDGDQGREKRKESC